MQHCLDLSARDRILSFIDDTASHRDQVALRDWPHFDDEHGDVVFDLGTHSVQRGRASLFITQFDAA
jgi:hypothetical protein